jgi:hypothetical protein
MYSNPDDQRAAVRRHYERNRDMMIERAAASNKRVRERNRQIIVEAKARPCTDCGVEYPPYVMQFDHVGEKSANVADMMGRASVPALLAEIARCEVVCANCHAERTYRRRIETDPCQLF